MRDLQGLRQQSPGNVLTCSSLRRVHSKHISQSVKVTISRRKQLAFGASHVSLIVRSSGQVQNSAVEENEKTGIGAGELTEYKDSWLDLAFINGCRKTFGRVANWQSPRSWEEGYLGMVEVSHALMRGRSAAEQQAAVLQGFPRVPDWFRRLFPYSDWGAELNARITPLFFEWLVGPCEIVEVQIGDKVLQSGVQIKKCRYLETSGCTGMCINLCKVPTQYFFTEELGMPLTMEPNFEDLSCKMIFGQAPPSLEADPALKQGCFNTCPSASQIVPCPKLK
ncbi:unnamed protein product [Calypogeia fissa]